MIELLRAFAEKKGVAVLTISHDLNITAKYAHKAIMLARPGVVYKVGTPQEVMTKENVETVYGIECDVKDNDGYPLLVFGGASWTMMIQSPRWVHSRRRADSGAI